ncbi:MAG: CDP-alcohol phosphatidyltransferase family protein [bacterium]
MVLDNYRRSLDWWLVPLAKACRNVPPDTITWLSLLAAGAGGILFWLSGPTHAGILILMGAWVGVGLNSILDVLDGKVAQLTGQATRRGDYLDHCVDRFSDAFLIIGLAFSPWAGTGIGIAALAGTLLTSYMGTQAQAVGQHRNYAGFLGRADRMVLLLFAPLGQAVWTSSGRGPIHIGDLETNWLELVLAYFAVVGALTTVQRFVGGLRGFGPDGEIRR